MINSKRKDIAELIGIAAIVASLIFVGLELRQSQQIALVDSFGNDMISGIEHLKSINENTDLWLRGNGGDELTVAEARTYRNLIEIEHALARQRWFAARQLGYSPDIAIADFAGFLYENPGALKQWEALQEQFDRRRRPMATSYTAPFATRVRADLEKFEELNR